MSFIFYLIVSQIYKTQPRGCLKSYNNNKKKQHKHYLPTVQKRRETVVIY